MLTLFRFLSRFSSLDTLLRMCNVIRRINVHSYRKYDEVASGKCNCNRLTVDKTVDRTILRFIMQIESPL